MELEFYETPETYSHYLFYEMLTAGLPIRGRVAEPCVGSGAIPRAIDGFLKAAHGLDSWVTNDLDARWPADYHLDAGGADLWTQQGPVDWAITNPPFAPALEIAEQAIAHARVGVAMHLRASIHEVLKTDTRRTWMSRHPPNGILWLPRFAYQRSKKTDKYTTDNVCACWVIWLTDPRVGQFIRYAPEWVLDELDAETPAYRARMDVLMGRSG